MWIGGTPTIRIKFGSQNNSGSLPFPLNYSPLLFYSARYALYYALKELGFKGGDSIFVPTYCCGTEIDPILALGCTIEWYPVNEQLIPDFRYIQRHWSPSIKGVLVTHYLGFNCLPEELVDFSREKKLILIEDCAHAFLSTAETGIPLGSFGNASVFSIRKTLPIPDGGCLFLKEKNNVCSEVLLHRPNPLSSFLRILELFSENSTPGTARVEQLTIGLLRYVGKGGELLRVFLRVLRKLSGRFQHCLMDPNSYTFSNSAKNWHISGYSSKMLQYFAWNKIKGRRRSNYLFLLKRVKNIRGIRPLFHDLPQGTCPLFFPILVNNRRQLNRFLRQKGIDSHLWWGYFHPSVPWGSFPCSVYLKRNTLGLPIHQDLDETHMDRIAWALRKANQQL